MNNFFCYINKNKKMLSTSLIFIVIVSIIIGLLCTNTIHFQEFFGIIGCEETYLIGEPGSEQRFCKIGTGPAIDRTAIRPWLSQGSVGYKNHEGGNLLLSGEQYRSVNGFLPPSFQYFPYGLNVDSYRPADESFSVLDSDRTGYNVDEGRSSCMKACKDTNCIAVQTEVPQNCYQRTVQKPLPDGLFVGSEQPELYTSKGDCKGKATHSCTLFYKTTEDADDAYFDISGGLQALLDPTITLKTGQKYYEMNPVPGIAPGDGNVRPSEEIVKWCKPDVSINDFYITSDNSDLKSIYSKYKTNKNSTQSCTCTSGTECTDTNCCVYRDLVTTDWAKYNTPYFNLPINVTRTDDIKNGNAGAICPAKDQNNNCCGVCPDGKGGFMLKSCPQNKQFLDGTLTNTINSGIWWGVDTERSKCMWPENPWWVTAISGPFGWLSAGIDAYTGVRRDMEECLENYSQKINSDPAAAYLELTKCCGYLDQSCMDTVTQPFCNSSSGGIVRGCFGDPHILSVDNVLGEIGACSNSAVIPPESRCIQDVEGKPCKGFPYGCESGPLWVMQ